MQEYNGVSDTGAIELAEGLSSNRSLQYLFLVRHKRLPHARRCHWHSLALALALRRHLTRAYICNPIAYPYRAAKKQHFTLGHLPHCLRPCSQHLPSKHFRRPLPLFLRLPRRLAAQRSASGARGHCA